MTQERSHVMAEVATLIRNNRVVKFLIVGGLSFAIDLGLLAILHEGFGVALWLATPIAFIVSLLFNFALQRSFTFRSTGKRHVSAVKYGALVVFNIVAIDAIVLLADAAGFSYAIGKVAATACTMVWNFFAYKYWIFPASPSSPTDP